MQVNYTGDTRFFVQNLTLYKHDMPVYAMENIAAHTFYISNSGTVFALSDHQVFFYDQQGNVETLQDLIFPNGCGFSENNQNFFVSDRNNLCVYSSSGDLVYELRPCRLFVDFQNGQFIATVSSDTLILYKDGKEAGQRVLSTPYIRSLDISEDQNHLIIETPHTFQTIELPEEQGQDK